MILVTGGTGLVGAHLLLRLAEKGAPVRALYRTENNISKTRTLFNHYGKATLFDTIEWVQGDITDIPLLEQAFKGVEYVYHSAALISFDPADEEKLRKINIEGTANVVNFALHFGIKKLCYVSSVAALGDLKEGETVITEETDWNPEKSHSDYAISKHGGEMEVWRAWQEGLEVVIVNPAIIFGYCFWEQGSGRMFTSVKKGQQFYTKGVCSTIAVEDVVDIMMKLMDSPVSGERYTLVAENLSVESILGTIAEGMNKQRPSVYATPVMTSFAWRADWLLSKLLSRPRNFTRTMARSSHSVENYSNDKIVKQLGHDFIEMRSYIKELAAKFTAPKG
jgi:dihydroflavonol-4-reductase